MSLDALVKEPRERRLSLFAALFGRYEVVKESLRVLSAWHMTTRRQAGGAVEGVGDGGREIERGI